MIRTEKNFLSGPFPADQVRDMIKSGKLSYQDEISPANGYWFYLHEVEEVKKHLGIDVPKAGDAPIEDATLTEFDISDDFRGQSAMAARAKARVQPIPAWAKPGDHPNNPHSDPDLPGVDDMPDTISESTALISGARLGAALSAASVAPAEELLPGAEAASAVTATPSAAAEPALPAYAEGISKEAEQEMRQAAELLAKENARRMWMLFLIAAGVGTLLALFITLFR